MSWLLSLRKSWLVLIPWLVGCGAILNGSSSRIPVDSEPQGVEVWVNDVKAGVTPLHVELENGSEHNIVFKRPGKPDQVVRVGKNLSGAYVALDILFTGLIGVVIDAATGAWYTPDPSGVSVLEPREPAPASGTTAQGPSEAPSVPREPAAVHSVAAGSQP